MTEIKDRAPVVVVEHDGRERHYQAAVWHFRRVYGITLLELERQTADGQPGEVIASYMPGAWASVRGDDAMVPDPVNRALSIARNALERAAKVLEGIPLAEAGHPYGEEVAEVHDIIGGALMDIFTEVEA